MRITNKTLTSNYLRNLNRNLAQMQKYHNQLSSFKEVSKPSDNPMLVSKIMSLKDNIAANEQYNTNISDSLGWTQTQDTALNDVSRTLNRIRDLMIYGANGSLSDTDRAAIKDEVEMQMGQLVDVLNTNFDGRYIFAGQKTTTRPFGLVDGVILYDGDENNIAREISTGVTIDLITSGREVVGTGNDTDNELGKFLNDVLNAFSNKEGKSPKDLSGDLLGKMDTHLDRILRTRSKIGAVHNRLEAAEARNKAENMNLKGLLSSREDIDVAEKYMEFSVMAVVYQASLKTGANILQPSLLDYLR
ncbi:flagellar hook-associated protein FlgL [Wansuia hejianensis]|uniref:Flagellar hook-associated protein FlgL n=1 Tax=Wansuia hejianensis TaxID=2763667 RepID=A0A926IMD5_9FIRM|nr:flagellar hook-associated protein FlgL [Wansuia hejianensis]MBC8590325.1 flagellar hook-associated protein FlgL [Wansuia hejianensis]